MMEQSSITHKNVGFGNSLIRIGDLVNFEGPLLSLFEDVKNGHLYIFDWVDRIDKANRWLLYQIRSNTILNFIQKKISYLELFESAIKGVYYISDITNNTFNGSYDIIQLPVVNQKYFPNGDDFFDKSDCPNYEKIINFLVNKRRENFYSPDVSVASINNHRAKFRVGIRKKDEPFNNVNVNNDGYKFVEVPLTQPYRNHYDIVAINGAKRSDFKYKKHA